MLRLPKFINKNLSVRLSLMVVSAMAILLMASMAVMLYYSRKAVREEALAKASQTLESTVQRIDNVLLSVEQSTGNIFFRMLDHLNQPDTTYSRKLVESNPYIIGCAIAFKEDFFKSGERFISYYHRPESSLQNGSGHAVISYDGQDAFHYLEQEWFTKTISLAIPGWQSPSQCLNGDGWRVLTFCLPIMNVDGSPVGVIAVEVSLNLLSQIVADAKLSANSYCTLLNSDGTFIVHPDQDKLLHQTVFTQSERGADPSVREAAEAMLKGETGYKPFRMNGIDYYVFFKPFIRSAVAGRTMERLEWSAGIIYPEEDIFGDYNSLFYIVLTIAIVGLLLLLLLTRTIIHRQLKPLVVLTESAQRIAKGHYDDDLSQEPAERNIRIPSLHQEDEISRLKDIFRQMQVSLSANMGELQQLTDTMHQRGEKLRAAYDQAQKAERMKTAFLHNMTNQMVGPAETIDKDVVVLMIKYAEHNNTDINTLVDNILHNGETIADLLNNLIKMSDAEKGGGQ